MARAVPFSNVYPPGVIYMPAYSGVGPQEYGVKNRGTVKRTFFVGRQGQKESHMKSHQPSGRPVV